jgi:hypothetical protein
MFRIVKDPVWTNWYHIKQDDTLYVGQLVKYTTSRIDPLGVSDATPETNRPFGIVMGFNDEVPTYNSTYKNNSCAGVATQALIAARKWTGQEGHIIKSDGACAALVGVIGPNTIIQGDIFNTTYGVAPTVVTCTTASTDGLASMVHGNVDITAQVAYWNTYCGRSGANRGIMRTSYATSRTTPTFYLPWPNDWTVGDTFVNVSVGLGTVGIQFDAESMFIDNAAALTSYFSVDVLSLKLDEAGKETATFRFVM